MLSKEDNDYITRTGPGTPMGKLFRQYWLPALLSSELPAPDCDPVRVLLLSEKLIAFRDSNGQVGLIQDSCPHRGASLFFGRNEECGLRCVYHGWKFDVTGACVDMPNEPAESNFKHKIKATAYPCQERNGVIWTYMGPRETPPPMPLLETNMQAEGRYWVQASRTECNWLQRIEGDFDTSHASFLHSGSVKLEDTKPGTFQHYMVRNKAPRYYVMDTPGGCMYAGYRDAEPGQIYYRIAQFILPAVAMTPTQVLGSRVQNSFSVPMDDTHTMRFNFGLSAADGTPINRDFSQFKYEPNSTDWYGRWRLVPNASNDYLIDRDLQRRNVEYTGIKGITQQDIAICESEGAIYDRSTEHLGTSDTAIIAIRRRMMAAARALDEHGIAPPGVDDPEVYAVRSGGVILGEKEDWVAATEDLRKAFVEHPEIEERMAIERAARRQV